MTTKNQAAQPKERKKEETIMIKKGAENANIISRNPL
jgi:hypothetical protein